MLVRSDLATLLITLVSASAESIRKLCFPTIRKIFWYCIGVKRERLIYLDFTHKKFTEIKSKCPNENDVHNDISTWAQEIKDEITENFEYLENEIQTTYILGYSTDYSHYCVQSLLNYVKWRLKNSKEIILQKTIILSRKINDQIPPNHQVKLPCVKCYPQPPEKYKSLESFRVGNRLTYIDPLLFHMDMNY